MEGNSSDQKSCIMRKQGCEIEAIGINYTILTKTKDNPFKIFASKRQETHDDVEVQGIPFPNKGVARRQVLKDVSCVAKPWEVLAVVGPSGAGKSSLLEILAGKASPQTGSVSVNGRPMDRARFKKTSGYVTQNDMLFPLLTVEETLTFSAKLRLGAAVSRAELGARVESLLEELGLSHVAGARVGDDRVRGISGGERRRVSIGVDVIHDPKVLILDEPTSGLDSSSALQVVDMLKTMAETRGRTVVLTVHQPGFRIVKSFNSLLFLANGSVLHHGTMDQLALNLRLMGLELPLHVNVVEFALDSIDRIEENKAGAGKSSLTLQQLFQQSGNKSVAANPDNDLQHYQGITTVDFANSRLAETIVLTHRFSKNIFRTRELFACRTVQMLVAGLVLGSIFHNLKHDLVGAQERVGLFAFILTFLLSSTIEALPIFLQERDIVMKETSCGSYRVSSYAIANALVYLPFLLILALLFSTTIYWLVGLNPNLSAFLHFLLLIWLVLYTANSVVVCFSALVPNFIVGNSVIAGVMGSFFLFSGYFISKNEIPSYWIFMHYVSLFKYPFEGFLINEFSNSGKCLEYLFEKCMVSGEDVLQEEGYEVESRWRNVGVMLGFIFLYRFISYVILRCRCSQRGLRSLFL